MTKIEAALAYASWGWHVLPVVPNGKVPATQHGVNDATTDQEQIRKWWTQNPDLNVGIAAGAKSGLVVFDIDPRNGGDDSWRQWILEHGSIDDGAIQLTAGGGQHFLAEYDPDFRSCKLAQGVDLLSDGRYFVAYPSSIEGRSYHWEAMGDPFDGVAPVPIPAAWKAAYQTLRKSISQSVPAQAGGLIQGNRNSGLTALGGAMRRYGMTEAEIFAALTIANETRCEIPLPASELAQIVRSVSRYEPDHDLAPSVGLGEDAAQAIIDSVRAQTQEYFFTRATSYLGQPAPIEWLIKGWIPRKGLAMIYGESGAGKTFITLDIACHIAAGLPWHGHKIRPGIVVYLAGEGHYGIRQRVAAWCRYHGIDRLDNLLISNKSIDIDSPSAAAQIVSAVRELTDEPAECVFVDTVNNHMSGDENSARETRAMLSACMIVGSALEAAVCLTHHTGNGLDSKQRARGSSAWRASLDVSLLVSNSDGQIEITCTKMKDAEPPKDIYGRLESVPLGWIDDEGEEIKGAVFVVENQLMPQQSPETKIQADIRKFMNAWFYAGAQTADSMPFLSREKLLEYLVNNEGLSDATAKTYIKESKKGRLIYNLLNAEVIINLEGGWGVQNPVVAASFWARKAER